MYENEIKRRQLMATQAEFCQQQLLIILSGLNRLFEDNHFKTLLRAERIVDMPENLSKCLSHYREEHNKSSIYKAFGYISVPQSLRLKLVFIQ